MNSPTLYQSLRTGALYRFVAHTNTGTFAWFERQDTGEQVRLRVASLKGKPKGERAMETFNHAN